MFWLSYSEAYRRPTGPIARRYATAIIPLSDTAAGALEYPI